MFKGLWAIPGLFRLGYKRLRLISDKAVWFVFIDQQFRVKSGDGYAEPNEGHQRIWQPIFPAQKLRNTAAFPMIIHPNIEKFIETYTWDVVGPKTLGLKIFAADVEIPFKWSYPPP